MFSKSDAEDEPDPRGDDAEEYERGFFSDSDDEPDPPGDGTLMLGDVATSGDALQLR